jgi:two-component system, cell cycle sensor histidine kinase and response regulator CckA
VETFDAALDEIGLGQHDVYLLDYRLGERTGIELLKEVMQRGCKAPLILLTGQGDRDVDLEAMKAGAAEYLNKGQISAALLERSIRYALERQRTQESLRQAQKMEAIGRLAGGVAHDFNNLLTGINGFTEISLNRLAKDDPMRDLLELVRRAGVRAAELTQQLLAFGRKQILTLKRIDLNALVLRAEAMLRRLIREDVELITVPGPGVGLIKGDPGQIEQIIVNLVVNARDAMPDGGKLTIATRAAHLGESDREARPEVRPGRYACLEVTDTGCGMDEATQAHLFEPFFTTKGVGKGTGLGLATVYGIVKQGEGQIYVASAPGHGTTFKVYFPSAEEQVPDLLPSPEQSSPSGGRETILLVEDEEDVRQVTQLVLRDYGYTILTACNGSEALRLAEQHQGPIHLLLTDLIMPQMNGRQLAERLTALRPSTKVFYLSGHTDDTVVRHGVLEGSTPFMQKPYLIEELARKVREVLDQASAGSTVKTPSAAAP